MQHNFLVIVSWTKKITDIIYILQSGKECTRYVAKCSWIWRLSREIWIICELFETIYIIDQINKANTVKAISYFGANISLRTHTTPCSNISGTITGISSQLPVGSTIKATYASMLSLSELSKKARMVQIFPYMKTGSLLSLGTLCDDVCRIILTNNEITLEKR